MSTNADRETVVDVEALFASRQSVLSTHNISGVKVLHLLVHAAGHTDTTWGETHAADGLGLTFCYMRGQFAAVYASNMDLPQRAGPLLGCQFEWTWTKDATIAWDFVKKGLDAGNPVKLAGPEDSIIYGYVDADEAGDRAVLARGVGGPAFSGRKPWGDFAKWVPRWVPLGGGGMYFCRRKVARPPTVDVVRILSKRVVEWQEKHPSVGRFGESSNFGISALEQFLSDLLQPEIEIPDEYIDCIAINFQHNARAALAGYFGDLSKQTDRQKAGLLATVAEDYEASANALRDYAEGGLGKNRTTHEGRDAIKRTVGRALEAEKRILGSMEKLVRA